MAHCICAACLASSSGRAPMPSVEPPLTPNPLACAPSTSFTPTPLGADIGSDFHVVAVAPPGTDCVEVRLRRLHRRLARPGRLAEAAPRRYRRHGVHRRLLDCVVRPARSQGVLRFSWWTPARSNGPRAAPRATPRTPSGFAACTAWVCSAALPTRRGHPRVARLPAPTRRAGHRVWPDHPAHAEGPGADQRQTDRGRLRHHG